MADSKKPSAAFWITVALVVVLVGYPLSFGPACWIASRVGKCADFIHVIYRPFTRSMLNDGEVHERIAAALIWYSEVGAANGWAWRLGAVLDDDGNLVGEPIWKYAEY